MTWYSAPDDVLDIVAAYLHTSDLARLNMAQKRYYVPEDVWTRAIRHRCGPLWPGGREGVVRLFSILYGSPYRVIYTRRAFITSGNTDTCMVHNMSGLHVWGQREKYLECDVGRVSCVAMLNDGTAVVGNQWGLILYPNCVQLWAVAGVTGVAAMHDGSIWFVSADQRAYRCVGYSVSELPVSQSLCVSGPNGLIGTMQGTFPIKSLNMPCRIIAQSNTLTCAWFADGSACTFRDGCVLHTIECSVQNPGSTISVIGDVVCINGIAWRDGKMHRRCPCDKRVCSFNGMRALTRFRCGGVGIIT